MRHGSRERRLQCVIGGMRCAGDEILDAEAADDGTGAVELRVRRETRAGVGISIGEAGARQVIGGSSDIACVGSESREVFLNSGRPGIEPGI